MIKNNYGRRTNVACLSAKVPPICTIGVHHSHAGLHTRFGARVQEEEYAIAGWREGRTDAGAEIERHEAAVGMLIPINREKV